MAVNQAVFIADLHGGCRYGLCPPEVTLDGGGKYKASREQRAVWSKWEEFHELWVPKVTRGDPYALVINGDAIDGDHHSNNTHFTNNLADQKRIVLECLDPYIRRAEVVYYVRGTPAHGGASGQDEEDLARMLGAKKSSTGAHSRFELRLLLGRALVDVQHHISTVGSNAYETTALQKVFTMACEEAGRWHHRAPDICVRSHRHRYAKTEVPVAEGHVGIVVTTPGWQLKTPLTFRMMGAQMATPQLGGILIVCGDEEIYERHRVWSLSRPKPEKV